jgi:polar amino acid transport system substrate-binding protein
MDSTKPFRTEIHDMEKKILLLITFFILLPLGVFAQKVIFVFEVYPPYEFYENGRLVGADVEIIREVCKRIKIDPVFRELPWERALTEVQQGKANAIFSLLKTMEREDFLYFPAESISYEQFIFIARKDSGIKVKQIEDLDGRRVGLCRGYNYDPTFDGYRGFKREYARNDEQQLMKLKAGRMDVAIMNRQVFMFTARKMGMQDLFKVLKYEITPKHYMYVGFSKAKGEHSRALAEKFDQVLKKMKKQGLFQKITEKQ